jgi:putative ATP-binding cassette transporter
MVVGQTFCSQMLVIRWRRWLTSHFIDLWMANESFYRIRFRGRLDNPDQRISDDIRLMIADTMDLVTGFLNAVFTVGAFASVLYNLSGPLPLRLFGTHVIVSGYLLWSSLIYWLLGAMIGFVVGNPLIWLTNRQQRLEADYRFALMRIREKAEAIALYHAQDFERTRTRGLFDSVNMNSIAVLLRSIRLLTYQTFITDAPSPLSFILCAPRFFAGLIPLGDMMRSANGFGQMSTSLSWFVSSYPMFADWHATVDRVAEFKIELDDIRKEGFARSISNDSSIVLNNINAVLPDGRQVFSNLSISLMKGEHVLLKGKSGSGKSTLFRIIAGIWPLGSGQIQMPRNVRILMLPQQPFIPIGTLRTALLFPANALELQEDAPLVALSAVGLTYLYDRLDIDMHWEQTLSPGEEQRIAIAQALIAKPDWLFLDEATSALDEEQERMVYSNLANFLPNTTIVSIGHRSTIESFHTRVINLTQEMAPPHV